MDFMQAIAVAVVSSTVVSGVLVFLVKKYLGDLIAYEFAKRTRHEQAISEQDSTRFNHMLETQFGIYPEIAELVYRLKVIMVKGLDKELAGDWSPELAPLCAHLTETLFKHRFFIPPEAFQKLHDFKRIAQDMMVVVDIHTREETLFDAALFSETKARIKPKIAMAETLYGEIIVELKKLTGHL